MFLISPAVLAATELPQGTILAFDKSLLINLGIQLLNISLLTFILAYFLYKPTVKFMSSRSERVKNEIDSVRNDRNAALELKEKYEAAINGIESEREEVLHQAYKKAMERSDQMLFDARRESELFFERAIAELEIEKKNQSEEMKRQIIELSVMLAGRIIEVNTDQAVHDRLFEEVLSEWEES